MARELKQIMFGIKAIVPYNRQTLKPYGIAEVVGSGGLDLTGEVIALQGGSSRYPWQNAHGFIEPKITINFKEFPSFLYNIALGVTPEIKAAADGLIENTANVVGSGLFSATGKIIREINITDKSNLKFGKYIVQYNAGGPSIDVFASSDIDAGLGNSPLTLFDDFLKINEMPIDVAQGADIAIPQLGVTLDVATTAEGFDATAADDGDSFAFEIIPPSDFYRDVVIGKAQDLFPDFGLYMFAEKGGDLSALFIDAFKCKMNGLPHTLTEKAYSEGEVTIMPARDGDRGVARFISLIRK